MWIRDFCKIDLRSEAWRFFDITGSNPSDLITFILQLVFAFEYIPLNVQRKMIRVAFKFQYLLYGIMVSPSNS